MSRVEARGMPSGLSGCQGSRRAGDLLPADQGQDAQGMAGAEARMAVGLFVASGGRIAVVAALSADDDSHSSRGATRDFHTVET